MNDAERFLDTAFFYVDTYGLPLEMVFDAAAKHGLEVNLAQFLKDALTAGWTAKHAFSTIEEALTGYVAPKIRDNTLKILKIWFTREYAPANLDDYWPTR